MKLILALLGVIVFLAVLAMPWWALVGILLLFAWVGVVWDRRERDKEHIEPTEARKR